MTSLSIILPEALAKASQQAAAALGVSRTQFIRQAIIHELENYRAKREQAAMAKSMLAMKKSKCYLEESEDLLSDAHATLPKDNSAWWEKN